MQSAYCSRFQKIKNLYKKLSFSNYYFEEINFNVFFYFPRRTSIGAICLLQSLPKTKNLYTKLSFSNYYFEEINFNVFIYFPRTSSIGAICLLQSLPQKLIFPQFWGTSSGPSFFNNGFWGTDCNKQTAPIDDIWELWRSTSGCSKMQHFTKISKLYKLVVPRAFFQSGEICTIWRCNKRGNFCLLAVVDYSWVCFWLVMFDRF